MRETLARLLPAEGVPAAAEVGAYWTRSNDVEIDIVGADRARVEQFADVGDAVHLEEIFTSLPVHTSCVPRNSAAWSSESWV